jgi:uncharacterized protein
MSAWARCPGEPEAAGSPRSAWAQLIPFASGLLFALGLGLSGMTRPSKVVAFLDVFGRWDPSLALVMGGALLVYLPFVQWLRRADPTRPWSPRGAPLDAPLILGAALFGVGWGLSGLCPGPALVTLASGQGGTALFIASMFGGLALAGVRRDRADSVPAGCDMA